MIEIAHPVAREMWEHTLCARRRWEKKKKKNLLCDYINDSVREYADDITRGRYHSFIL